MPFGLKSAGATYQRLVNKIFAELLEISMEVYIDDMLVKSAVAQDHVTHLDQTFSIIRQTNMMLNPNKCTFTVKAGKFLGFMVSQRGIEAHLENIRAILDMGSPRRGKEVQKLTGCITVLNKSASRSTYKCLPFFNVLRGNKEFAWTEECERSFRVLKIYLGHTPILVKLLKIERLFTYLAVLEHAVSSVLVKKAAGVQVPVYYVSKRLLDTESRYPKLERLTLALITTTRKLQHYFLAHLVVLLTNYPIKQVRRRPEVSARLVKWAVE